jgi:uncharacterized protein
MTQSPDPADSGPPPRDATPDPDLPSSPPATPPPSSSPPPPPSSPPSSPAGDPLASASETRWDTPPPASTTATPDPSATPPGTMPPPPTASPEGYGYQSAPPAGAYGYQQQAQQLSQQEERTWGMVAHLSALIGIIIGVSFVGPLIVMLVQGPKSRFVRDQAVEALNFNITVLIAVIISSLLIFLLIGLILLPIVLIAWLVFTIIGAVTANDGRPYRYPINIRMVK